MSRFGGISSRSALSVMDNMHASILTVAPGGTGRPATATVSVSATGKVLSGVIYGRSMEDVTPASLKGTSVVITRVGGRWAVLG